MLLPLLFLGSVTFMVLLFLPRSVLLQQIRIQNVPETVFEWRWDRPWNTSLTVLCRHEGKVRRTAQMAIQSEGRLVNNLSARVNPQ